MIKTDAGVATEGQPLPLSPIPIETCSGDTRRLQAERQRKRIRAAARRLFSERGYAGFHINDLASSCDLALQTLYNHLGGREEILSSSVDELLQAQVEWANAESARTRRSFMLVWCDLIAKVAELDRSYAQSLVSILKDQTHRPLLADLIEDRCKSAFHAHLRSLQDSGMLKHWVNIDTLAVALQDIIRTIITARIGSNLDAARLHHELLISIGLLLFGATCGDEAHRIEAALASALGPRLQRPGADGSQLRLGGSSH
ncbi:MAG: TetR/AcrR family transcriptional regulator [Steroidobacteraceae bacterium]